MSRFIDLNIEVHVRATARTFEVLHASASEKWVFEGNYVGGRVQLLLDALNALETTESRGRC